MPIQTVKKWPKKIKLLQMKLSLKKQLIKFSCTYQPLSSCKIKKKHFSGPRVMRMHHFWAQNGPFAPNKLFLENYLYHSHLPISLFCWVKFKKNSSSGSRVVRMHNFWAQNGPFPQIRIFFRKPVNELCFFVHAYLQAKNQSQIFVY